MHGSWLVIKKKGNILRSTKTETLFLKAPVQDKDRWLLSSMWMMEAENWEEWEQKQEHSYCSFLIKIHGDLFLK